MAIGYILWQLWYIFPILVCCTKNYLATLAPTDVKEAASRKIYFPRRIFEIL
jgi:hypothetical protein